MLPQNSEQSHSTASKNNPWLATFYQNFARILKPYTKSLVLLACCFIIFAYVLTSFNFDPATLTYAQYQKTIPTLKIDQEWPVGFTFLLSEGKIAGRDFFFTYGFLGQLFTVSPTLITGKASPFSALPVSNLIYTSWTLLAFSFLLLLIKKLNWRYSGFIFLFLILTGFMLVWPPFRLILTILNGLVLIKALTAKSWLTRILLAGLSGISCFLVMTFTFELGLYGLAIMFALCGGFAGLALLQRKWPLRSDLLSPFGYLSIAGVALAAFIGCNLLISLYFKLTSPTYQNFFDYQIYSLEIVRGYNFIMGNVPKTLSWFKLFIFGCLLGYVGWFIIANFKIFVLSELYFFCMLLLDALIWLKSMFTRTNESLTPAWMIFFVFLLTGYKGWETITKRRPQLWLALLIISFCTWHFITFEPLKAASAVVEGNNNLVGKLGRFAEYEADPKPLLPADILNQLDPNPKVQLFTYPYQYSMSGIVNKQNPHATLQNYVALSTALQDKVVASLQKTLPNVEVLFGINFIKTAPIDAVADITRSPIIFEYIYTHFEIKKDILADDGYLLLKPRAQVKPLVGQELKYQLDNSNPATVTVKLSQPASCNMLRITPKISYPLTSYLGRPSGFTYTFYNNYGLMVTGRLVALEAGKPFTTFIPLMQHRQYQDIFANRSFEPWVWHTLTIEADDTGILAVNPNSFGIEKIECIVFSPTNSK